EWHARNSRQAARRTGRKWLGYHGPPKPIQPKSGYPGPPGLRGRKERTQHDAAPTHGKGSEMPAQAPYQQATPPPTGTATPAGHDGGQGADGDATGLQQP
ncbi:MAG: hypothetical protein ACPIOQ_22625, partial [Promethearchaeia archaeon]